MTTATQNYLGKYGQRPKLCLQKTNSLEFDFKVNIIVAEMNLIHKSVLIAISLLVANSVFGQIYKMKEAVEMENFKRLEKVCLDALEDKDLKRSLKLTSIWRRLTLNKLRIPFISVKTRML